MIKYKYSLGFFLSLALISYLSLTPDIPVSSPIPGLDKVVHFIFYFVLTWLLGLGLSRELKISGRFFWLTLIAGPVCIGVGIELIQSMVPGREREYLDIVFNILGTMMIVMFFIKTGH